jgi:hypothetical protein
MFIFAGICLGLYAVAKIVVNTVDEECTNKELFNSIEHIILPDGTPEFLYSSGTKPEGR